MSLAIWDHTVLPVTSELAPLNQARQTAVLDLPTPEG